MPLTRRSQRLLAAAPITEPPKTGRTPKKRSATAVPKTLPQAKKPKVSHMLQSQAEINAGPNCSLRIFCLPREVFDEIISHLTVAAEAAFTLTCKEALHAVGTASWKELDAKARWGIHRVPFIELLSQDIAGAEYCVRCNTLHPPLKPPHAHRATKVTKFCYGPDAVINYWPNTPSSEYSLLFAHIQEAFKSKPISRETSPPIDWLAGNFALQQGPIAYKRQTSARWVQQYLILRHEHHLYHTRFCDRLKAADITSLPFRLCAHQTTSTDPPPVCYYTRKGANSLLLTHAIVTAFPEALRSPSAIRYSVFRKPSAGEQEQMTAAETESAFTWKCRSCPTKFRVRYVGTEGGKLVVTSYHCFGKELYKTQEYWKFFVRREGSNLGPKKRNSEFYSMVKSIPNFPVE